MSKNTEEFAPKTAAQKRRDRTAKTVGTGASKKGFEQLRSLYFAKRYQVTISNMNCVTN